MNGKIKQAFTDNSGVNIHFGDGDKKVLNVEQICGGIAWATVNPYYVCFIGKEYLHDESGDYRIHLLYEIEDDLPGSFHESFTNCSLKLLCRTFSPGISISTLRTISGAGISKRSLTFYLLARPIGRLVFVLFGNFMWVKNFVSHLKASSESNFSG